MPTRFTLGGREKMKGRDFWKKEDHLAAVSSRPVRPGWWKPESPWEEKLDIHHSHALGPGAGNSP